MADLSPLQARIMAWLAWAGHATTFLGQGGLTVTLLAEAEPLAASLTLPRTEFCALVDAQKVTIAPVTTPAATERNRVWIILPAPAVPECEPNPNRRWTVQPAIPWGHAALLCDGTPMLITAAATGDNPEEHLAYAAQVTEVLERLLPAPNPAA